MRKPSKQKIASELIKANPSIDAAILRESMGFVDFIRHIGVKNRGFRLIPSSEDQLRPIQPVRQKFSSTEY